MDRMVGKKDVHHNLFENLNLFMYLNFFADGFPLLLSESFVDEAFVMFTAEEVQDNGYLNLVSSIAPSLASWRMQRMKSG